MPQRKKDQPDNLPQLADLITSLAQAQVAEETKKAQVIKLLESQKNQPYANNQNWLSAKACEMGCLLPDIIAQSAFGKIFASLKPDNHMILHPKTSALIFGGELKPANEIQETPTPRLPSRK